MNGRYNVSIIDLVTSSLTIYRQQTELIGRQAIIRMLVLWLMKYPVPPHDYDQVFRITMEDRRFYKEAFVLYQGASRDLQVEYRRKLVEEGAWIRIWELVKHMNIALSHDEISAIGRAIHNSTSLIEKNGFYDFVRCHPTFPSMKKKLIEWSLESHLS